VIVDVGIVSVALEDPEPLLAEFVEEPGDFSDVGLVSGVDAARPELELLALPLVGASDRGAAEPAELGPFAVCSAGR